MIKARLAIDQLLTGDNGVFFQNIKDALLINRRENHIAHTGTVVRVTRPPHDGVKAKLRSRADQVFKFLRRAKTRDLNKDAVRALTLNCGLAGANFVNPATDNF